MLAAGIASAAPPMQIKYAEPIQLVAAAGKAQVDVYGRRFSITLENNDRLLKSLPAARKADLGQARILRGKLEGLAGSWVRLTRVGGGLEGAIWDGNEMYVVTRLSNIVDKLTTPLAASPDQTVVYRLSDIANGLPPEFCGLSENGNAASKSDGSALQQYKSLVADLRTKAAAPLDDQLDISLIADTAFQNSAGPDAEASMLARLNIVDGIFAEQVGILLAPLEFRLVPANADPFTTINPEDLLDQLAAYREATPAVRSAGLAHLMTGKDLTENVLGIAFIDSLCRAREGVSLSNSELGDFWSALVMAHELGHNFGARHDGVPGICESTPQGFLMAPYFNQSATFSDCSLSSMAAAIAGARGVCVGSAHYVDLAIALPTSPYNVQTNGTFSLPMTVRSLGNLPATNAGLKVTFPLYFGLQGASLAGANCSISLADRTIDCTLDEIAAGEERVLDLRVTGDSLGSFPVNAVLTADNDLLLANNSGQVQIGVQSGVDLGVSVTVNPTTAFVTDAVDYTADVTAHGTLGTQGGTFWINIGGIPIESFNAGPHLCNIDPSNNWVLFCNLADIAAGATTRITVRGRPEQARPANGVAVVGVRNDNDPTNDSASFSVAVSEQREVRTRVSAEVLRTVVGTSYELTYTLNALGILPAENVRFQLQQPPNVVIESVTSGAVVCTPGPDFTNCAFGTLNPGDVRTILVRFHMTASSYSFMNGATRWTNGSGEAYSTAYTQVYGNVAIDAAATIGDPTPIDEGITGEGAFNVQTVGVDPAQNVVATLELAAPLRLLTLTFFNGPTGWTCQLLSAQRGRCSGSFAGGTQFNQTYAVMQYTFASDTAVNGQATLTVTAPNDGNATNNVMQAVVTVRPFVDIGISGATEARLLVTGTTTTVNATITTGKNPVPGAQLLPWASDAHLALDSLSVDGIDCSQTQSGSLCNLGDLPANSTIPVRAVFRAVSGEGFSYGVLDVRPDRDSNGANNHLAIQIYTLDTTDIGLSLAQNSVTVTNGSSLQFPRITLTNGAVTSRNITIEIPLPTFVEVSSISAFDAICSGTSTLVCTFLQVPPSNTREIDISLNTRAAGAFTSNVTMSAINDSTAGNNAASVAITVNEAPSGGGGGGGGSGGGGGGGGGGNNNGGGSGGGGSLEWFALALLGALGWRRRRGALVN